MGFGDVAGPLAGIVKEDRVATRAYSRPEDFVAAAAEAAWKPTLLHRASNVQCLYNSNYLINNLVTI